MMKPPKIISAQAIDDHTLKVEFDNSERRRYDISRLLDNDMFAPLKNPALFRNVQVEAGGYAISWNKDIDLSEHEIWTHGVPMAG
jgi:hypothetical protein